MGIQTKEEYDKRYQEYTNKLCETKEIWKPITIDNVETKYKISNHGKIMSFQNNTPKIKNTTFKKNYEYVTLYIDGVKKNYQVHRLMALTFIPIPERYIDLKYTVTDLQVNHINGIPLCNAIFNLEWCTPKENTVHAHKTGLAWKLYGENSTGSIMSDREIHQICQYLEEGKSNKFIKSKINVSDEIIHSIRVGETWTHISCKFKFIKRINSFDDETIHAICKDIASGMMSGNAIARKYNASGTYIQQLRRQEYRPDITKQYDFSKFIIKEQIPDDIIHGICKDLEDGETIAAIARKTGLSKTYIADIKHHRKRKDISIHYNF